MSVALGAGVRTNPLLHSQDLPLAVVPQFSYYGKKFFIDNLDLGYSLLETDSSTLSLIATPGYDRIFFYRNDLQNIIIGGVPQTGPDAGFTPKPIAPRSRDITYLAGPEWTVNSAVVAVQLDVLHEITGHDHGDEIRAAVGIPLTHAAGKLTADLGLTWKSAGIVDYYYGTPPTYEGGSALDPFAKLDYSLALSHRWRFIAFAQYEYLSSAIAHSPLVAQHYVVTAFTGFVYAF